MVLSPESPLGSGSSREVGGILDKDDAKLFYNQAGGSHVEKVSRNFHLDSSSENPWSTPSEMWEQEEALMDSHGQMQLNFLDQKELSSYQVNNERGIGQTYEGSGESLLMGTTRMSSTNQNLHDMIMPIGHSLHTSIVGDSLGNGLSKDSSEREIKQEMRADSSDSDPLDDDEDKGGARSGRRHLSKNLVAERKRRKKLNERLYALRALVPKITKMDRASILGDAIEYVKELQQRVELLQKELLEGEAEDHHDVPLLNVESLPNVGRDHVKGGSFGDINSPGQSDAGLNAILEERKVDDFVQEMEVNVHKLDDKLFCIRLLCERSGGMFISILRVIDAFGLDILHANISSFRGLNLTVFNAEVRDKENPNPEQLTESLLELSRQSTTLRHVGSEDLSQVVKGPAQSNPGTVIDG